MFNRFFASLLVLSFLSFNVSAASGDNPFAKNESLNIGKDIAWDIDKKEVTATKTVNDEKGTYYHLQYDNKQLKLFISNDAKGKNPKQFSQLEVKDVVIDGDQSPLFKWCLMNQERHSRFLQQGLNVKKNVCVIDGNAGTFIINLNKDTLLSLQNGSRLLIMLKPFRTPLELNYDISDFKDMYLALNARPETPAVKPVAVATAAVAKPNKKCWAGPPAQYKNIKSVEYDCNDASAKLDAEIWVTKLVNQEKAKEQQLAAEKEKQLKLAEEKKQKELAEKLKLEEQKKAEAAAIAASEAKQAAISDEITQKMISVCDKFWSKGEHRCYCQKYIDHAPEKIRASSTCE
jgi:hypothetical protein